MSQTLRIVHNLARSGSTLLCRCIGSMSRVRLLSEIHPQGRRNKTFSAVNQYQQWYGDIGIADYREPKFLDGIIQINAHCEQDQHKLVLRDWAHIDFIGPPSIRPPGKTLALDQALCNDFNLTHAIIVRHPLEMWRSLSKLSLIIDNNISLDFFLAGYRQFLTAVEGYPAFRYEDFTADPTNVMTRLCEALKLPFDPEFINRWPDYHHVTGDIWKNSRASGLREIRQLSIQPVPKTAPGYPPDHEDYQWIIKNLGYEF